MTESDRVAVRRTVVFAACLAVLLAVARSGYPTPVVMAAFTLFVVAATLWIRGQYMDSLDDSQWHLPRWATLAVLVLGVALVALYLVVPSSGMALTGVLLLYFLAGATVTWLRQGPFPEEKQLLIALVLLGAGALLGLSGILVLGGGSGTAWIVLELALLGLAFLALVPVGLALLSEVSTRRLCAMRPVRRLWIGLAGFGIYLAALGTVWAMTRSPWLLGALLVLGALVAAMTSMTQADIAAAMSVVALLGVTPLPADVPPTLQPDRTGKRVLVAFGDSYMSGEGAATYYKGTDEGGGNQCRRSPTAWAALAGQQRPFERVEFLACSGARTFNVRTTTLPSRPGTGAPEAQTGEGGTQLDRYLADYGEDFTPSMVVVGIGGNDAGFSTIGMMCLAPGNCSDQSQLWTDTMPQVRASLRDTYAQIDALFPDTPVVAVPYPDPIALRGSCADVSLAPRERQFLHRFVTDGLNLSIAQTAREFGFYYLSGMQSALADAHLQLCDPQNQDRPGLNFIGVRSVRGVAEQRFNPTNWAHSSLHPNERGHAAMLRVFESWLPETVSTLPARVTAFPADATVAATAPTEAAVPPCDLLDTSPGGCRPRGTQWAKGQIRAMLLADGWLALVALVGIWLAAIAFFGDRRHHAVLRWNADHRRAALPEPRTGTTPPTASPTRPPAEAPEPDPAPRTAPEPDPAPKKAPEPDPAPRTAPGPAVPAEHRPGPAPDVRRGTDAEARSRDETV